MAFTNIGSVGVRAGSIHVTGVITLHSSISEKLYIYIYIYIYNLHNGECASVFNALLKTRRVSAFAFLRGLNMQLLQSIYIYIYIFALHFVCHFKMGGL